MSLCACGGSPSSPVERVIFSVQGWLMPVLVGNTPVTRVLPAEPAAHHKRSNPSTALPVPPHPPLPRAPGQASPASRLLDALPRLHLPPEAVPEPGSKPAFLQAQEDAGRLHHQDEGEEPGGAHGSWARGEERRPR